MTGAATKTETYTYVYEGESILMEILSKVENGGAPVKEVTRYVHSQRIDEPLAMERGGQYYYYHSNRLGSIAAITNTAKAIVQSYTYDSFGMPEPSTIFRNSYTYTGREWDGETGLYYYRARYYDPMAGRFVSKDPIGFNGGDVNLYGYTSGNPINQVDPLGHNAIAIAGACAANPKQCSALVTATIVTIANFINTCDLEKELKKAKCELSFAKCIKDCIPPGHGGQDVMDCINEVCVPELEQCLGNVK